MSEVCMESTGIYYIEDCLRVTMEA